jgi:hypothetical protein
MRVHRERDAFIDDIQVWFGKRNRFWTLISVVCLVSIIVLQLLFMLLSGINSHIRDGMYSVLVPVLVLFVVSIFWRGTTPTILSLAGVMCLYVGMFFVYALLGSNQDFPSQIANRLGYGIRHTVPPAATIADFYFLMGIGALVLGMAVAFRPSIFRAKGSQTWLPYPIWTNGQDSELSYGPKIMRLIPLHSLLSFEEQHLVAKYKYIQVAIGGKIYFVSPDEWIPESSHVVRERRTGSLLGIPKVPDGFNIW